MFCYDVVVMAAARSTPVPGTLAEEASWRRLVTVPMERQPSRAAATARTATAPATATFRRARCLEAAEQVLVRLTAAATWVAAAATAVATVAAGRPVLAGSATTAVPSSQHLTQSSVANAVWLATRDVFRPAHPRDVTTIFVFLLIGQNTTLLLDFRFSPAMIARLN